MGTEKAFCVDIPTVVNETDRHTQKELCEMKNDDEEINSGMAYEFIWNYNRLTASIPVCGDGVTCMCCKRLKTVPKTKSGLAYLFMPPQDPDYPPDFDENSSYGLKFEYLTEAEQPFIRELLVNGVSQGVGGAISQGDAIVVNGGNFDDLNKSNVQMVFGSEVVTVETLTATQMTATAPPAFHSGMNLKVMAGWKGWVDFNPLVQPADGKQRAQVRIIFGGGANEITSITPSDGSILGGTRLTIAGRGFQTTSGLNIVKIFRTVTGAADVLLGLCDMRPSTLSKIECVVPALDRSTWTPTTIQETVKLEVNGISVDTSAVDLSYTYTRAKTPRVLRVEPRNLSYALTGNITLIGQRFGLLQRRVTVMFGERSCRVWNVNQTHVVCQLMRSAMAQPPLCTAVKDVYDAACIVKPMNFSMEPTLLVTFVGYALTDPDSSLDTRFEIHNVTPSVGSEEGGTEVAVRGIGFGSPQATSQLMIAVLGTLGDYSAWSNELVVFRSRNQTLNVDFVDLMTNLITAEHMCGPRNELGQPTKATCKFAAFKQQKTPTVMTVSPASGRGGTEVTFTLVMPLGYGSQVRAATAAAQAAGIEDYGVEVWLGGEPRYSFQDNIRCPSTYTTDDEENAPDILSVKCTLPEFEAGQVLLKVLTFPLGFGTFSNPTERVFTNEIVIDSLTPSVLSLAGGLVKIAGAGFAADQPKRHLIKLGDGSDRGVCTPVSSTYGELTCIMNWAEFDTDGHGERTVHVTAALWKSEVGYDAMEAFGNSAIGCLRGRDDWTTWKCLSEQECALRCLMRDGCKSFDFLPGRQLCRMSRSSFTGCSDCITDNNPECRYFERITEISPSAETKVTKNNAFKWDDDLTPDIQMMYVQTDGSSRTGVQTSDNGCGANNADLASGNNQCCANVGGSGCSQGEGHCSASSQCAGNLRCEARACSWSFDGSSYEDSCCTIRGHNEGFPTAKPLWRKGDTMAIRVQRIGVTDYNNGHAGDSDVQAAISNPGNGYMLISFDGVACDVTAIKKESATGNRPYDVFCTLGDVPGGLVHHPLLTILPMGRAREPNEWLYLPLEVTAAVPADAAVSVDAASLGGGWTLNVSGTGFAAPPDAGADSYVEVAVCGKRCEVVNGSYTEINCTMPNVSTPEVADGSAVDMELARARVVSRGAGMSETITPICFHGPQDDSYEVGHPLCAALFDGDPELTGGLSSGGCHVGVDFGDQTDVRIEQIRYHPHYDYLEARGYVNSRFEVGTLDSIQTCDELTYGWRGDAYLGCQDKSIRGLTCLPWNEARLDSIVTRVPELSGHSYCRNPTPGQRTTLWCKTSKGKQDCMPKMPSITWTVVHTITTLPRMLWNTLDLATPKIARYMRYVSPPGNCRFTEIEVIGQLVAPSGSCNVAVRNVRRAAGQGYKMYMGRPNWRGGVHSDLSWPDTSSDWVNGGSSAQITFSPPATPVLHTIEPMNGTARGGTEVTLRGVNFGPRWTLGVNDTNATVVVEFNGYDCNVTSVVSDTIICITTPRNEGIRVPSMMVHIGGVGRAIVRPGTRWRYLDRWSSLDTWANQEPPVAGDLIFVPDGQAVLLDEDTPNVLMVVVEGTMVFDDTRDVSLTATYIWVKGGIFEIGTADRPYKRKAVVTLTGNKYEAVRLPVIGAKVLAVSNTQFTIREGGDGAMENGNIGTMDIHGAPRIKVWTRLAVRALAGSEVIILQDDVDWQPGEELLLCATVRSYKHFDGNGMHGAPPVDFQNERIFVKSVALDMRTITLMGPLEFEHESTRFLRPDGETIDLSAEVGLLTRNVKIQGDASSELDSWGGHTMMAFGGIYRLENAEFFSMGQQGELSRYPIHFHVSQDWGKLCYAKHNSIHHSFQRAVAIHSTSYVWVYNNVAFDIVGHMFFIETGMEKFNTLEHNLGVGAIPLLSGMLESDQEPAGFWTAAPNNQWIDNVAITGSDGWYFQLSGHPISHNMDLYKDSVCPVGDRIGEWTRNRCHHTTGTCIRIYLTWIPTKDPCNKNSGENPQILFNTTCWGVGKNCYNAMKMGSVHLHHLTAVEGGGSDFDAVFMDYGGSYGGAKFGHNFQGIAHIKDSVFVNILPQHMNIEDPNPGGDAHHRRLSGGPPLPHNIRSSQNGRLSMAMAQDEQFYIADSWWLNYLDGAVFKDCNKCWFKPKWRQGAFTYRFKNVKFENSSKRIFVHKKGIFYDMDGSLSGTPKSYTTWADKQIINTPCCTTIQGTTRPVYPDWPEFAFNETYEDSGSIFYVYHKKLIHTRRDHAFVTCTNPIRKLEIAWPGPEQVVLRQLNSTNLETGLTHVHEYEPNEVWGWAFPVPANVRMEVRPNFIGLDLEEAVLRYAFYDVLAIEKDMAMKQLTTFTPEWFQLQVASWSSWDHYQVESPWWECVATRHGGTLGFAAKQKVKELEPLPTAKYVAAPPSALPSMSMAMHDPQRWSITFAFPDTRPKAPSAALEPLGGIMRAQRCPKDGCVGGVQVVPVNVSWPPIPWSTYFGPAASSSRRLQTTGGPEASAMDKIVRQGDWVVVDVDDEIVINTLQIFGMLSFDDKANRVLQAKTIQVWGLLEIGNDTHPFGQTTGTTAKIRLDGQNTDVDEYVYMGEESLRNKVIGVGGRMETNGARSQGTWMRLKNTISSGATQACIINTTAGTTWKAGSEIAFSPTDFSRNGMSYTRTGQAFADVEKVSIIDDPVYVPAQQCYKIEWKSGLSRGYLAEEFSVGGDKTVTTRAVVARIDRSIIIESVDFQGSAHNYGGHIEVLDVPHLGGLGRVKIRNTRFHNLGKGGLDEAFKIAYSANNDVPPSNTFQGNAFTNTFGYALRFKVGKAPLIVSDNVFVQVHNGGIYVEEGTSNAQILNNCVIGVAMSPQAPSAMNEWSGLVRYIQFAGIRADDYPARMMGNVVAASNDIGFLHRAEKCPGMKVLNNEAFNNIVGVFLTPQRKGRCQAVSLYKIWKAAHIGMFLADVAVSTTQLDHITVVDSHMGIVPYMTVGNAYRRIFLTNTILVGTSPAIANDCSNSNFCRAQNMADPWKANCNSEFKATGLRRIGYVTPFNTANRKTCDMTMDPRQCKQLTGAYPNLDDCHFPFEKHIHFDRGLGWTFASKTTFAYWKASDCGMSTRAISMNPSGPEIGFPVTFDQTTWYETDHIAKFELSTISLDGGLVARRSPCKSTGGGCMGLDQGLFQDLDGTLLGLPDGSPGSVIPNTARTEIVWASQCSSSEADIYGVSGEVVLEALVCPNLTVQLVEMRNLDRGAKDVKFGPWVMTPNVAEDNGFVGGVISSVGPFYGSCPCGWDFSFYHALIKPSVTYYSEVLSLPENFMLRYWSPRPEDSILLQYFYPDSRGVNVFVGSQKEPDMELRLGVRWNLGFHCKY
jgi:hypothetical protein